MLYANNAANHHHRRSARRLLACCTRTNGGAHRKLVYYMVGCQLFAHHNNRRKTLRTSGATQISYDVHFNVCVCVCVIEQSHVDGEIPLRAHVCIISHKSPHWSQLTLYPPLARECSQANRNSTPYGARLSGVCVCVPRVTMLARTPNISTQHICAIPPAFRAKFIWSVFEQFVQHVFRK